MFIELLPSIIAFLVLTTISIILYLNTIRRESIISDQKSFSAHLNSIFIEIKKQLSRIDQNFKKADLYMKNKDMALDSYAIEIMRLEQKESDLYLKGGKATNDTTGINKLIKIAESNSKREILFFALGLIANLVLSIIIEIIKYFFFSK
jgi:hypothetical protein